MTSQNEERDPGDAREAPFEPLLEEAVASCDALKSSSAGHPSEVSATCTVTPAEDVAGLMKNLEYQASCVHQLELLPGYHFFAMSAFFSATRVVHQALVEATGERSAIEDKGIKAAKLHYLVAANTSFIVFPDRWGILINSTLFLLEHSPV
jgi:hypothetical protein